MPRPQKKHIKLATLYKSGVQYSSSFFRSLKTRPERFFLVFSLVFGGLFVFLVPPLQAPDENSHFRRAYQISDLNFIAQPFEQNDMTRYGSHLPVSVNTAIEALMGNLPGKPQNEFDPGLYKRFIGQPLEQDKTEMTLIEAAGVYSPIVYIPQAIGIGIGKLFDFSPLLLIWLGRLMNLLLWVTAIYWAIRLLPIAKWGVVVLALNPVAVFISASISPDVINISLAFLFVSLILTTFSDKQKLTTKKMILIMSVLAVLSLSKPVNMLFSLLLFAIPYKYFETKTKYILYSVGGVLLSGQLFVLWNSQIKGILEAAVYSQSGGLHISVRDQLAYILSTPFGYAWDIIRNYIIVSPGTYGDAVLGTYFGVLGWLDTTIPLWTIILYILVLFVAALYQFGRGIVLNVKQKIIFAAVFMLAFVGNITAMYFNATVVGSHTIGGVQGRYFIPFSILLLGLFSARQKVLQLSDRTMFYVMTCGLVVVLGVTSLKLFLRYYPQ